MESRVTARTEGRVIPACASAANGTSASACQASHSLEALPHCLRSSVLHFAGVHRVVDHEADVSSERAP
eukprot:6262628-Alexandrium_andersonii.AAC.1